MVFALHIKGQPKKSVVLSGEAMKEVQKQAKAAKDERRLQVTYWWKLANHDLIWSYQICGQFL